MPGQMAIGDTLYTHTHVYTHTFNIIDYLPYSRTRTDTQIQDCISVLYRRRRGWNPRFAWPNGNRRHALHTQVYTHTFSIIDSFFTVRTHTQIQDCIFVLYCRRCGGHPLFAWPNGHLQHALHSHTDRPTCIQYHKFVLNRTHAHAHARKLNSPLRPQRSNPSTMGSRRCLFLYRSR